MLYFNDFRKANKSTICLSEKLLVSLAGIKEDKAHGFYEFEKIEVVSAGERDPDSDGVEGMSASKMRAAAVEGDFESFRSGVPSEANNKIVKKMFNDIRKGMRLSVVAEGKSVEVSFYDPYVDELIVNKKSILKEQDIESASNFDMVIIHTPHTSFSTIDFENIKSLIFDTTGSFTILNAERI